MKIQVTHIPNTFNNGSLMMAVSAISYLHAHLENVKFFVDCQTAEDLARLKRETGIDSIEMSQQQVLAREGKLVRILSRLRRMWAEGRMYNVRIVLGGDDISEYYQRRGWLVSFPLLFVEHMRVPTILLGQTIGPFTSYRRLLARFALSKAKIYTRDDDTLEYVQRLGLRNVHPGRDLAFMELPNQKRAKAVLTKYNLEDKQYIVFVPSGLVRCYTNNYSTYIEEYYRIIRDILLNEQLSGMHIVLLAHVRAPGTSDKTVIDDLYQKLTREERMRVVTITDDLLASEARAIIGNAVFTITGRMHAAVSSFYMRRPAISLSYSVKYEGVIAKGLGLRELVIEAAGDKLWETGQVSKGVLSKIEYVLQNYDELVKRIDRAVDATTKVVVDELDSVVKDIRTIAAQQR